ncbi:MAG: glycosyltransferase family 39 protein [Ardenticatenales bacterium]|nr:glycosyltransferase family 39 protein [Ardenticatenales bacterium]
MEDQPAMKFARNIPPRWRVGGWLLLILLVAATLRLVALSHVPPGFTHDEADHGLDAWGVVNGIRPIYFTVGYGREPLFDYSTAILMAFLGPTYLAGRLTAVFYSLLMVAGSYAWVRRAFERRLALLTAAGLAVSFWGVMTGRQALRSVTMPAFFLLAATCYWNGLRPPHQKRWFIYAGIFLGITFYTYLPARLTWALFPGLLLFTALLRRDALPHRWRGTAITLLLAGIIGSPLFYHLQTTAAEARLTQLSGPLNAAAAGDFAPLWHNFRASLRLFTLTGDTLWRYNIPGKPWLGWGMGILFYLGLLLALIQIGRWLAQRNPAAADRAESLIFALAWLVAGMVPAFITGPEASTTRAIAMQPILYLFPALPLIAAYDWLAASARGRRETVWRRVGPLLALLLFAAVGAQTARDYFHTWANNPEVRVQYESTLVAGINYLNEHGSGAAAISTATPDRFHSPSTALMTLRNPAVDLRWFNGAGSLLLPQAEQATLLFPGFAPLHPDLARYFTAVAPPVVLPLRPTDEDRPLTIYTVVPLDLQAQWGDQFQPFRADLDNAASLLGYEVQTPALAAGETARLATWWQARQSRDGLVFFTHLTLDGPPLAQADRLDVPSYYWHAGDQFIQLHTFTVPPDLPPGAYALIIGAYVCPAPPCAQPPRLTIFTDDAAPADHLRLPTPIVVTAP